MTNVEHLTPLATGPAAATDHEGLFKLVSDYVKENELLTEWDHSDVELSNATGDETELGKLTHLEKEMFVLSSLLVEVIRDEMVEAQASSADEIAAMMRRDKINVIEAASRVSQEQQENVDPEVFALVSQLAMTSNMLHTTFEWLVRTRHNEWSHKIIVRSGFVAYAYG